MFAANPQMPHIGVLTAANRLLICLSPLASLWNVDAV